MKVVVFGSSGFVGRHIKAELAEAEHEVVEASYRMTGRAAEPFVADDLAALSNLIGDAEVVVNAAGNPDASSEDRDQLELVNAYFAGAVAAVCTELGVRRFVHVSSATVQGDRPVLDETPECKPFSAYSASKVHGEELVIRYFPEVVIYRPGAVHSPERRVTRTIHKVACSPLRWVARPGTQVSPQALIFNVAAAVRYLVEVEAQPPRYVAHPWEGLTTADVVELFGHRSPIFLPQGLAKAMVAVGRTVGRVSSFVMVNTRRVEMLLFGQGVKADYFRAEGWSPPHGREAWEKMTASLFDSDRALNRPE